MRLINEMRSGVLAVAVGAVLLVGWGLAGDPSHRAISLATSIIVYSAVAIGLGLLWGQAGQVSVAQAALMGLGAYTAAVCVERMGLGFAAAIVISAIVGMLGGLLTGLASLRVSGHYFVILTFAIGQACVALASRLDSVTGGVNGKTLLPEGRVFGLDLGDRQQFLVVAAGVVAVLLVIAIAVVRSHWGAVLRGMRENGDLLESIGFNVRLHRIMIWAVAGGFAAVGGQLYLWHRAHISPTLFDFKLAILLLLMPLLGGRRFVAGGLVGAAAYVLIPEFMSLSPLVAMSVFGAVLIVISLTAPDGLIGLAIRALEWLRALVQSRRGIAVSGEAARSSGPIVPLTDAIVGEVRDRAGPALPPGTPLLRAEGLIKTYGGVTALDSAALTVMPGEIVGLIGPNGSGKTTMLNVVTGFVKAEAGDIYLKGDRVTGRSPSSLARHGMARTFQQFATFGGVSVRDNLELAYLQGGRTDVSDEEMQGVLEGLGLPASLLDQPGAKISWGQGRLLGLAMAVVRETELLLLDEPFAGVQRVRATQIGEQIRSLRDRGMSFVIVEHDMSLLLPLCDRVTVMDGGRIIGNGTPQEILADPVIQSAYLGGATA